MILVIRHTQERNEYDASGRLIAEAGEQFVSHAVNTVTGKTIIMPCEKWSAFKHLCVMHEGEWYLK